MNKVFLGVVLVMSLAVASLAGAVVTAQISTVMDAGKWTEWENQVIAEVGTAPAPLGVDHTAQDDDTTQDWYVPNWVGGKIVDYKHVRFELTNFQGEYAFRVSFSEGVRWSPLETCVLRFVEQDTIIIHSDS